MKPDLSRELVVHAGVELAAQMGIEAVGIRSVAGWLRVTPMALYRYVETGSELEAAVLDAILMDLPQVPAAGAWTDRYRAWARATRLMLAGFPGVARHLFIHCFELRQMLVRLDRLVAVAEEVGLAGFEAVAAANVVLTYVLMRSEFEYAVRTQRAPSDLPTLLQDGPVAAPHLAANAAYYADCIDQHFEHGLETLLSGLELRRERAAIAALPGITTRAT